MTAALLVLVALGAAPASRQDVNERITNESRRIDSLINEVSKSDSAVRLGAIVGLGVAVRESSSRYHAKQAVTALRHALAHDDVEDVREAAAEALGRIGLSSAVPTLRAAIAGRSEKVRIAALEALGEIGSEARAAIPDLIRVLAEINGRDTLQAAAHAVGGIGASAAPPLLTALHERERRHDDSLFEGAVDALAAIGPPALPTLRRALRVPGERSRAAAAALMRIGIEAAPAVHDLVSALASRDPELRFRAAAALGRIGADAASALPALGRLQTDANDKVRSAADQALNSIQTALKKF